ncbi:MAG: hypothetical protein FWH21_05865 [Kiritimatiellaeota bacterium]|nr:hypothetical protein [Kiritimatiellota bacterium]
MINSCCIVTFLRKKKNVSFFLAILAVVVTTIMTVILPPFLKYTREGLKWKSTFGALWGVSLAIDNTIKDCNLASKVIQLNPDKTRVQNGQIVDAWGNPITVTIERIGNEIHTTIISAGSDGVIGTNDDIVHRWSSTEGDLVELFEDGEIWHNQLIVTSYE